MTNAKIFLGPKTKWKPCKNGWRRVSIKIGDRWVDLFVKEADKVSD